MLFFLLPLSFPSSFLRLFTKYGSADHYVWEAMVFYLVARESWLSLLGPDACFSSLQHSYKASEAGLSLHSLSFLHQLICYNPECLRNLRPNPPPSWSGCQKRLGVYYSPIFLIFWCLRMLSSSPKKQVKSPFKYVFLAYLYFYLSNIYGWLKREEIDLQSYVYFIINLITLSIFAYPLYSSQGLSIMRSP